MSAHRGTESLILLVCVANVCRSPTMQFLTGAGLQDHGAEPPWELISAGTMATDGQHMCKQSAKALSGLPGGREFAEVHRSRRLTEDLIARAGLIVVTSHKERSTVARASPPARARTFTMLEAALLAESAFAHGMSPEAGPAGATVEGLAEVLHRNRGLLVPGSGSSMTDRFNPVRRRRRGLDIMDVHTGEVDSHALVIRDLRWASHHLTQAITSLTSAVV